MQQLPTNSHAQICLWYLLQHSISSFNKILHYFSNDAETAILPSQQEKWQQLGLHKNHLARLEQFHTLEGQRQFQLCLETLLQFSDAVLLKSDAHYPDQLQPYADSPPLLFVQGDVHCLSQPQIAIVGSRKLSPYGGQTAYNFAQYFAQNSYIVTSGLASGIDAAAHQGALSMGKTIAIIGTGLDQCYPNQHIPLWQQIIQQGGAVVSEFLPHTPPAKQNFPRRNRIISALSEATLVVEAGLKSGSLITARLAAEQGKHIFAIPGHISSTYHQGCHQLIREGAILVDHPAQVLEDLTVQYRPIINSLAATTKNSTATITQQHSENVPEHLMTLFAQLDYQGLSLDQLALRLNLSISDLNVALVELELLGLCCQYAGRYLRCS